MLEHEIFDTTSDNFEQLSDKFLPLILLNVRLQPQFLPKFLRSLNDVSVWLRGFSLFRKSLLLCMRFS